jgi:hypothetical protein
VTRGLLALLLCLGASLANAKPPQQRIDEGQLHVRVGTEPAGEVVLGQQTRFFVDILTDSWFTQAPRYPELPLEGAIALMPEQLGSNFTERIDGVTFAAQRRSYVIFPQRAGVLEIPALTIRLGVAEDGEPSPPFRVRTRPLALRVVVPAAAQGVENLVTTPDLSVRDEWSKPAGPLRAGDAVKRSVTLRADDALGMLLPKLVFDAPEGIAVYADQPQIKDRVNRGEYRGERVESVTYVMQEAGEFTLPRIEFHWWNPSSQSLVTETLAARSFQVSRGDAAAPPADLWTSIRKWLARAWPIAREHWLLGLVLTIGAFGGARLLPAFVRTSLERMRAFEAQRQSSEAHLFRRLEQSLRGGSEDEVVARYWQWRDRLAEPLGRAHPRDLVQMAQASGFADAWARFERARYGGDNGPQPARGVHGPLRAFRAALLARARPEPEPRTLGRLNPRAESSQPG